MYTSIHSIRVYEQVAEQIEQRILSSELRAGDRLPTERELSQQFGVSRTSIREAMKSLAQKGLVDMRPGRGTIVIDATSQAMRYSLELMMRVGQEGGFTDLEEVREMLEPEVAALAATRALDEHVAALREAIQVMDINLNNADAFIAADNQFHLALARGTQNRFILTLVNVIVGLLSEQSKLIFSVPGGPERSQLHHRFLLGAIERKHGVSARMAMQAHLRQVREDVRLSTAR